MFKCLQRLGICLNMKNGQHLNKEIDPTTLTAMRDLTVISAQGEHLE